MKKLTLILITIISIMSLSSCDFHYEDRDIMVVIVDKNYTPSHTTYMSVPMQVGKVHTTRMQPIHHPDTYTLYFTYTDTLYTNYGIKDNKNVSKDIFNNVNVGDTIYLTCSVKISNK